MRTVGPDALTPGEDGVRVDPITLGGAETRDGVCARDGAVDRDGDAARDGCADRDGIAERDICREGCADDIRDEDEGEAVRGPADRPIPRLSREGCAANAAAAIPAQISPTAHTRRSPERL